MYVSRTSTTLLQPKYFLLFALKLDHISIISTIDCQLPTAMQAHLRVPKVKRYLPPQTSRMTCCISTLRC